MARNDHIAFVRLNNAGRHTHCRGFARAVLTKETQDLALVQAEAHRLNSCPPAERL